MSTKNPHSIALFMQIQELGEDQGPKDRSKELEFSCHHFRISAFQVFSLSERVLALGMRTAIKYREY
jgi:hypothetical protein